MPRSPAPAQLTLSVLVPVYNERYLVEASLARVLAFRHEAVSTVQIVVVDDGSTDGSADIVARLAAEHPAILFIRHPSNMGKGAAIRTAIDAATGQVSVIHDADLEYYPDDWSKLLRPFLEVGADAVFGSRFLPSDYRRVLLYSHTVGNRLLTTLSNLCTDLNLTDMETCYKMVRTSLLKSIPIRGNDFTIEPELVAKLAKRGAVIYEVPIRYSGRTYNEGKKINARDGFRALSAIVQWWIRDDLYRDDEYGSHILTSMNHVQHFNSWMADAIAPHVGARVLEIGAGIGNLTTHLFPRDRYVATDINPHYLAFLTNLAVGRPQLEVRELDLSVAADFAPLAGQFDTVVCLNVLEHVPNEAASIANIAQALAPGGKAIVLVPHGQWLHSSLDEALGHVKRYSSDELRTALTDAGLSVSSIFEFNHIGVPGWFLNGRVLGRRHFSRIQLKILNTSMPWVRKIDHGLPWPGLSIVAVAHKPLSKTAD